MEGKKDIQTETQEVKEEIEKIEDKDGFIPANAEEVPFAEDVCPFCGDRRGKCNFVVYKDGELANVYHYFHCDAAGNMLMLYAELTGLSGSERYKEVYREILQKLHLGTGEQIEKRQEIQAYLITRNWNCH